jgi:hypothetical protein
MLNKEYLADRIKYHGDHVEAHVLALGRAIEQNVGDREEILARAAKHAAIFNALVTIASNKP